MAALSNTKTGLYVTGEQSLYELDYGDCEEAFDAICYKSMTPDRHSYWQDVMDKIKTSTSLGGNQKWPHLPFMEIMKRRLRSFSGGKAPHGDA